MLLLLRLFLTSHLTQLILKLLLVLLDLEEEFLVVARHPLVVPVEVDQVGVHLLKSSLQNHVDFFEKPDWVDPGVTLPGMPGVERTDANAASLPNSLV